MANDGHGFKSWAGTSGQGKGPGESWQEEVVTEHEAMEKETTGWFLQTDFLQNPQGQADWGSGPQPLERPLLPFVLRWVQGGKQGWSYRQAAKGI